MLEHVACAAREALCDSLTGWPRELRAGRQSACWTHPRERSVRAAHRSRERRDRLERQRARRDLDAAQTWRLRLRRRYLCPKRADAALALRLNCSGEGAVAEAVALRRGALCERARDRAREARRARAALHCAHRHTSSRAHAGRKGAAHLTRCHVAQTRLQAARARARRQTRRDARDDGAGDARR